jgi:hypothetical protein
MLFSSWLRNWKRSAPAARRAARKQRLCLESLEDRLTPANVLVVPFSEAVSATQFHTLALAVASAGPNGTVTVEPGASPDTTEPVLISLNGITIQGDPNTPAAILPSYQLTLDAQNVTLTNLNLQSVSIGSSGNNGDAGFLDNTISKCVIGTLNDFGFASTVTQNTITNSASVTEFIQNIIFPNGPPPSDVISNNTFTSSNIVLLQVNDAPHGVQITGNTFVGGSRDAIVLENCWDGNQDANTLIANNTITPGPGADGIELQQVGTGIQQASAAQVDDNIINTQGGVGVFMVMQNDANFSATVDGNDFHGNAVGVFVQCSATGVGNQADISVNSNNFRSFNVTPATAGAGAIVLSDGASTDITADSNLFGVSQPSSVVFTSGNAIGNVAAGTVSLTNSLMSTSLISSPAAFVQTLYLDDLGRVGSASEINQWVTGVYDTQGQAAVVQDIYLSQESLGRIVDSFYLRFLGRQSDAAGRAGWISFLQNGGTEQQMENLFLTSPEYLSHIDTDFVQSLYINILGRTGSSSELAGWNNQLQTLGLVGVANGFTGSTENRDNIITADYESYLHRAPTTLQEAGLASSSQDLLIFAVVIQSTPEFFQDG